MPKSKAFGVKYANIYNPRKQETVSPNHQPIPVPSIAPCHVLPASTTPDDPIKALKALIKMLMITAKKKSFLLILIPAKAIG